MRFEPGGNLAAGGELANTQKKLRNDSESRVDVYTKILNHRKILRKT